MPRAALRATVGPPAGPVSRRLDFRPIGLWDIPEIVALHREPRITAMLVDDIPDDIVKAHLVVAWNAPFAAAGFGTFAVRRRGEPALIGLFSLTPYKNDVALLELGGKLTPSAWGGRIAIEAGAAMIDHAFDALGRDRLVSAIDPAQRSAAAALRRLGFTEDGEDRLLDRPVIRFSLIRSAFRPYR
ncbi:GNAT family N-acetyltransferase [Sphingomonas sp. AP4-R1]|uniref:GNAT family N-acetyltransferase n=1 Tax=Sphingomonas sp. AP4-R1 TaxID=2735134 RepID=UPI001493A9B6|nr:GNAT family N-acetyltransferase [Sphingomonas sp. AP4-R1]QJU59889.1 GNAT family N-acetyltransferase [Sphingomonas sp. AP4-R1]